LRKFVAYCSHAKQIREDLDGLEEQAKVPLPTGNHVTLPNETRKQQKMTKAHWDLMP